MAGSLGNNLLTGGGSVANSFGGDYATGGHSGEAFNTAMKDVLHKHPEYLAKVGGKHVPWSLTAKLNTANPDIKSIKDFTERDRIAVPSIKVSVQAVLLQMAAAAAIASSV